MLAVSALSWARRELLDGRSLSIVSLIAPREPAHLRPADFAECRRWIGSSSLVAFREATTSNWSCFGYNTFGDVDRVAKTRFLVALVMIHLPNEMY